jgi:hypothetical protein
MSSILGSSSLNHTQFTPKQVTSSSQRFEDVLGDKKRLGWWKQDASLPALEARTQRTTLNLNNVDVFGESLHNLLLAVASDDVHLKFD